MQEENSLLAKKLYYVLEGIDAAGRNVMCDNFFTSLSLARKLLEKTLLACVQ